MSVEETCNVKQQTSLKTSLTGMSWGQMPHCNAATEARFVFWDKAAQISISFPLPAAFPFYASKFLWSDLSVPIISVYFTLYLLLTLSSFL
jgi:hypothetical protein